MAALAPVDRTEAELKSFAAKYTIDDLETFQAPGNQDKRTEHRDFCAKAKLPGKQCFALANYTAPGSNIETAESHQGNEKLMQGLVIDHGLGPAFDVWTEATAYVAPVAAVAAVAAAAGQPAVAAVQAVAEAAATYTRRAFFGAEEPVTFDDVKRTSRILSCHHQEKFAIANSLGTTMVLNQCKPDLRKKIENELENACTAQERGGIVAMYLVRQTIANSSVECSEVIKEDLKKYKINQVKGENVDEVVRVIKGAHQILVAGQQVPPNFVERYAFRIFTSSSTPKFNAIFEGWSNQCAVTGNWPQLNEVCERALATYTKLSHLHEWKGLGTPARAAAAVATEGENPSPSTDGSSKKKGRIAAAANATDTPTEKIREFTFDGTKVKGNIAPPAEADKTKPRKFDKLDGTGFIELWHCAKCGAGRNGMWKKHHTANHPNAPPTSPPPPSTASESSRHVTFSETASTFVMPTMLDRSTSE